MGGGGGAGGGGGMGEMFGQIGGGLAGAATAIQGQDALYLENTQGKRLDSVSPEEDFYKNVKLNAMREGTTLSAAGPGVSDVSRSLDYSRGYGDFLAGLGQTGGLPSEADIRASQDISANLFAPERTGLRQSFEDALTQSNRQAAILGRSINDPILMNKLNQEQVRQTAILNARQGARAQEIALQLPQNQAAYRGQAANVFGGLASQAFANRAALLSAGSNAQEQERAFRINTAQTWQRNQTQNEIKGDFMKGGVGWFQGAAAGGRIGAQADARFASNGGSGQGGGYYNAPASYGGYNSQSDVVSPYFGRNSGTQFGSSAPGYGGSAYDNASLFGGSSNQSKYSLLGD